MSKDLFLVVGMLVQGAVSSELKGPEGCEQVLAAYYRTRWAGLSGELRTAAVSEPDRWYVLLLIAYPASISRFGASWKAEELVGWFTEKRVSASPSSVGGLLLADVPGSWSMRNTIRMHLIDNRVCRFTTTASRWLLVMYDCQILCVGNRKSMPWCASGFALHRLDDCWLRMGVVMIDGKVWYRCLQRRETGTKVTRSPKSWHHDHVQMACKERNALHHWRRLERHSWHGLWVVS